VQGAATQPTHQPGDRVARMERAIVFVASATLILVYALRGGTYDLVLRQEAGVVVWWALTIGIATGLLPRGRPVRALAVPAGGLALFVLWTGLAHGWSESDERTSAELARTVHHAGILILALGVLDRRTWGAAVSGVLAGMAVVCALSVGSRLAPGAFPNDDVRAVFPSNRLSWPLNYWNAIAAWAAVCVALALPVSAHARSPVVRGLALAVVPLPVVMAYLTYSRGGALGIGVAIVASVVLGRHRLTTLLHLLPVAATSALAIAMIRRAPAVVEATGGTGGGRVIAMLMVGCALSGVVAALTRVGRIDERLRVPRRIGRPAGIAAAATAAVVAVLVLPGVLDRAWEEFRQEPAIASAGTVDPAARLTNLNGARYQQFASALRAFEGEPLLGIGPGAFEFWWNRDIDRGEFIRDAHSLYLETLAELGVIGLAGLVLLLGGMAMLVLMAGRRMASPAERGVWAACMGGLVVSLFHAGFEWIWEATANAVVLLVLAGAGAAALNGARTGGTARPWRIPAVILALLAILVQLPPMVSTSQLRESQAAVLRGDDQAAMAAAIDAVETQPWAASPYIQRALLAERAGQFDVALRDVGRAEKRERTNWRHPLLRARLLAQQGKTGPALVAFRRARSLHRGSAQFGG
jgi:hypothetical protein